MNARPHRAALALTVAALLAGCGKAPTLPTAFEATSETAIGNQRIITARDTGTGCEIVIVPGVGVMARNERSADGVGVKQRCVLTGGETPVQVETTVIPATTSTGFSQGPQATVAAADADAAATPLSPADEKAVQQVIKDVKHQEAAKAAPKTTVPPPSGRPANARRVPRDKAAPAAPPSAAPSASASADLQSQMK